MSVNKQQSAIKEARDQLFLDTADGVRLNVVASNLGLDRPLTGIGDDQWRSIAKNIALQPKLVRNVFARLLEVCIGPQTTKIANLQDSVAIADQIVQSVDSADLLQLGTLIFSPGQPAEETISFCFRDIETNKIFLNGSTQFAHTPVAEASGHLLAATAAGAAALVLISTKTFPTTGYPYSLILGRATETEETVVVTNNDIATDTLTLLAVTTIDQPGPKSTFLKKDLDAAAPNGQVFIVFDNDDTRVYPGTGFIRLDFAGGNEETREYESNDIENNILHLRRPLANNHVAGEAVELVTPGAVVETCSVIQQGAGWAIHETEPRKIKVFAPALNTNLRSLDASWFHGAVPPPFATTVAAAALSTDTIIAVTDASGFPDEAGLVLISGTLTKFYILRDEDAGPPAELHLTQPIGTALIGGESIALIREVYPGTSLEEGNPRTAGGALQANQFPGPYLYDITQRAPSLVQTALDTPIPKSGRVAVDSVIGQTCLEVDSAFTWPAPPFTPFDARIGRDTGFAEDRTLIDRTLKTEAVTTVNISPAPNPGALILQGVDTTTFPQSNGVNPALYRIIIDRGGANEEILTVAQNAATAPGNFTLNIATAVAHAPGESIELLNDILTFDALTSPHEGPTVGPSVFGALVDVLVESIDLVSGGNFPDVGGVFWINFGKARINVRTRIVSVTSPTVLVFADTSLFPPASVGAPWELVVGEGLPTEERAFVIGNNTGTNELTMSAALVGTFLPGQYVEFIAGDPITVEYVDRDTNTVDLAVPTVFPSGYTEGETIIYSPSESIPSEFGTDYALLMPPDSAACLLLLFDLVRAAGVQVEFLENT